MKIKSFLPGISIAILISLVAWTLGVLFPIIGGPVIGLFIGLLFGIVVTDSEKLKTGMQFTSKKVLQYAVILLGFGLNLSQVFQVGLTSLPIILATIATALVTAYVIQKLFNYFSRSWFFNLWRFCYCGDSTCHQSKRWIYCNSNLGNFLF